MCQYCKKGGKLTAFRGDDIEFDLFITDENNNVVDLTGYTVTFTVKKNSQDPDDKAVFQKHQTEHIDPGQGHTYIHIPNIISKTFDIMTYYYDVQIKDVSEKIKTLRKGCFEIKGDITINN